MGKYLAKVEVDGQGSTAKIGKGQVEQDTISRVLPKVIAAPRNVVALHPGASTSPPLDAEKRVEDSRGTIIRLRNECAARTCEGVAGGNLDERQICLELDYTSITNVYYSA